MSIKKKHWGHLVQWQSLETSENRSLLVSWTCLLFIKWFKVDVEMGRSQKQKESAQPLPHLSPGRVSANICPGLSKSFQKEESNSMSVS